jgi:hypothetical protein
MWTQSKFFEALGSQIDTICEHAAELMLADRRAPHRRRHWIPLDAPQVVIDAITAMVADIRTQASG